MEQDTQRKSTIAASMGELHWSDDAPSSPSQIKHHARNISLVFSDTGPLSEIDENEVDEEDDEAHEDNDYADEHSTAVDEQYDTQGELLDEAEESEDVVADWAAEADDDDDNDDAWASAREAATSPVWSGSAPAVWGTADDDTDDAAVVDLAGSTVDTDSPGSDAWASTGYAFRTTAWASTTMPATAAAVTLPPFGKRKVVISDKMKQRLEHFEALLEQLERVRADPTLARAASDADLLQEPSATGADTADTNHVPGTDFTTVNRDRSSAAVAIAVAAAAGGSASTAADTAAAGVAKVAAVNAKQAAADHVVLATTDYDRSTLTAGLEQFIAVVNTTSAAGVRAGLAPLTVCMRRLHSAVAALLQPPTRSYIPHARRFAQVLRLFLHAWQALATAATSLCEGPTQHLQQISSSEAETALQLSAHALRVTHLADSLCSAVALLAVLNRGALAQQSTAVLVAAAAVCRAAAPPLVSPTTARRHVPLPPPLPRYNLSTESSKLQRAPLDAVDEFTAIQISDEMAEAMQNRFSKCISALPHCSLQYAAAATDAQTVSTLAALISPCLAQPVQAAEMLELVRKACPLAYATAARSSSSSSSSSSADTLPRGCPVVAAHITVAVRPEMVEQLVLKLLTRKCSKRWVQPIVVTGPQSAGKTLLAATAVCRADVRARFKGAVFWLTLGPMQPHTAYTAPTQQTVHSSAIHSATQQQQLHVPLHTHLPARYRLLLEHLACQLCMYIGGSCSVPWGAQLPSETELTDWLTAELAVLQSVHCTECLLVADDVYERATLDNLTRLGFHVLAIANAAGELSNTANTVASTTSAAGGAVGTAAAGALTSDCDVILVDRLDSVQAFELLTQTAGVSGGHKVLLQHSSVTASILSHCRGLPLALNTIGAVLHGHATDAAAWSSTATKLQEAAVTTTSSTIVSDAATTVSADAVALQSATLVCIGSLSSELQQLYVSMAILPQYVPASEKMLRSLWSNVDHATFTAVTEALLFRSLLRKVHTSTASSSSSRSRSESPTAAAVLYTVHAAQMECIRTQCGASLQLQEQLEVAAGGYTYFLGQLKVLKAAHAAPPWGPASTTAVAVADAHVPFGRLGLSSCWCVLQALFDITAIEAYSDSLGAAGAQLKDNATATSIARGTGNGSSSSSSVDASLASQQLRVADYLMCCTPRQHSPSTRDTADFDTCSVTAASVQTALHLYSACAKQFDTLALPTGHSCNNSSVDSSVASGAQYSSPSPRTRSAHTNLRHQIAARKGIGRCLCAVGRGAEGVQQYSKGMLLEQALYDSIQRQQQQQRQQLSGSTNQFSIQQQQQQLYHPQLLYSAVEHCRLCSSSSVSGSASKQAWQDLIEILQVSASAQYSLATAVCLRALASYDIASTHSTAFKQQQQHEQKLLLHAVKLEESWYGANHPALATALLTAAVQIQPCSAKSVQLCKRAVRVYERTLGACCSEVAVALQALSDMLVKLKRYADACEALQRALSIVKLLPQRSNNSSTSSSTSTSSSSSGSSGSSGNVSAVLMQRLAAVHVLQGSAGDIAIAEQLLRRALALQLESIAGQRTLAAAVVAGGSVHVLQAQRLLAQHLLAHCAEDTMVEITTLLEEALALSVSTFGAEHSDTLAVLQSLVAVKQAQGIV
jgi:tetratricopeptide (TPR) repeat protein